MRPQNHTEQAVQTKGVHLLFAAFCTTRRVGVRPCFLEANTVHCGGSESLGCTEHASKKIRPSKRLEPYILWMLDTSGFASSSPTTYPHDLPSLLKISACVVSTNAFDPRQPGSEKDRKLKRGKSKLELSLGKGMRRSRNH